MKTKKKLTHLFDATQCVGCLSCVTACAQTNYPEMMHDDNEGWDWLAANIRRVTFDNARRPVQLLLQCQQCDDAPCVKNCPFGANYYDMETGQVKTDPERCVGCNYCVASCPYDARWSHPKTGLPMKCMGKGCEALIAKGEDPACVQACPAGARVFGDINDPNSPISRRIAQTHAQTILPQKGTKPNFYVVVTK